LYIFVAFGAIIGLTLLLSVVIGGSFNVLNLHLAAYGYILAMQGFIIALLKQREKNIDKIVDQVDYAIEKRHKELRDDILKIKGLLLTMEVKHPKHPEEPRQQD